MPILAAFMALSCTLPPENGPVRLVVPQGADIRTVSRLLADAGLVRSQVAFRGYWRFVNRDTPIDPGPYYLPPRRPIGELAAVFLAGPNVLRFVVYRGSTAAEIAALAEQHLGLLTADFRAALVNDRLRRRVKTGNPSLEGYLLPKTYYVNKDVSAEELVEQFVDAFEEHWRAEWSIRALQLGLTRDEVVTLASIIEGEIVLPQERDTVSSVYHNRLETGMPLQADPTIVYALGERRRLLNQDYRLDSPYNTYRNSGLPPGPIGQPTVASIEAALFPARTPFFFFVAADEEQHLFSESYEDHLIAIEQLRNSDEEVVAPVPN